MTTLPLDIHLMIEQPERQFEAFAEAGGDIINFHVEATPHADRLLRRSTPCASAPASASTPARR